jgi:competence protein ComEA
MATRWFASSIYEAAMNPFLDSTIAVPLASEQPLVQPQKQIERPRGRWSFPFAHQAGNRLARRSSVAVMLAGVGVGLSAQALELNTASAEQLKDLRGVGPRTAQIIVQERNRAGPFESLEDLSDRVRGIGPKRLQALQASGLRVSETGRTSGVLSGTGQGSSSPVAASQGARGRVAPSASVATPLIETSPSH